MGLLAILLFDSFHFCSSFHKILEFINKYRKQSDIKFRHKLSSSKSFQKGIETFIFCKSLCATMNLLNKQIANYSGREHNEREKFIYLLLFIELPKLGVRFEMKKMIILEGHLPLSKSWPNEKLL